MNKHTSQTDQGPINHYKITLNKSNHKAVPFIAAALSSDIIIETLHEISESHLIWDSNDVLSNSIANPPWV